MLKLPEPRSSQMMISLWAAWSKPAVCHLPSLPSLLTRTSWSQPGRFTLPEPASRISSCTAVPEGISRLVLPLPRSSRRVMSPSAGRDKFRLPEPPVRTAVYAWVEGGSLRVTEPEAWRSEKAVKRSSPKSRFAEPEAPLTDRSMGRLGVKPISQRAFGSQGIFQELLVFWSRVMRRFSVPADRKSTRLNSSHQKILY